MPGNIPLKEFQSKDLNRYVSQRKKKVKPATANRAIAAISKLFPTHRSAVRSTYNRWCGFPICKEAKMVFRPLTVQQFRDMVETVDNPYLQAMVALIGETGIREGVGLSLT